MYIYFDSNVYGSDPYYFPLDMFTFVMKSPIMMRWITTPSIGFSIKTNIAFNHFCTLGMEILI